nr:putative acyltransferase domain protein [Raoultella sp. NCTC 9187]
MSLSPTGEHLSIIEHTDVDESLKGQGVGKKLVAKVVEKMRGEQRKIIPLCPFAKHEFDNTANTMISAPDINAPAFAGAKC